MTLAFYALAALWTVSALLCLAVVIDEVLAFRRGSGVSEHEARENARPTSSAVNTIYDRAPLAPVVPISAARASAGLGRPAAGPASGTTASTIPTRLTVVPRYPSGGDAA